MKGIKKLNIRYYALFRECAGKTEESLETIAKTPRELYKELASKYNFPAEPDSLRVAINDEFKEMDRELFPGDRIIFIPPVAGG